jgi:hypothetical protein
MRWVNHSALPDAACTLSHPFGIGNSPSPIGIHRREFRLVAVAGRSDFALPAQHQALLVDTPTRQSHRRWPAGGKRHVRAGALSDIYRHYNMYPTLPYRDTNTVVYRPTLAGQVVRGEQPAVSVLLEGQAGGAAEDGEGVWQRVVAAAGKP